MQGVIDRIAPSAGKPVIGRPRFGHGIEGGKKIWRDHHVGGAGIGRIPPSVRLGRFDMRQTRGLHTPFVDQTLDMRHVAFRP
ncbi:hypothetical protein RB2654_14640 [Rhodobacterales bacterium HTCC2654]|uniref:Uncharacterized protein n=1 Tax=Maritimibacter alkaliphilus HTCC2654 TaxID=314271 RepID=A3VGX7_9RHOB|nr:hypothetical protein RB2654_14640 [Rhodobacterales bacterium HTCC2654] [Maritimibacter alkaliphilus HTCC2654]